MDVPCPICDTPLTGDTENEVLKMAMEHVRKAHHNKDVDRYMGQVRGIIRNLPTPS